LANEGRGSGGAASSAEWEAPRPTIDVIEPKTFGILVSAQMGEALYVALT